MILLCFLQQPSSEVWVGDFRERLHTLGDSQTPKPGNANSVTT